MTPLIIPQGKGYIPNQFVYEVSPLKELLKEENGELWLRVFTLLLLSRFYR
jgi:hypothetical protein